MGKITQEIAQIIIDEYVAGESAIHLADKYGLWHTSICNLISGRSWPQCKRPDDIESLIRERRHKGLACGIKKCKNLDPLTDFQRDILVGSLLGDGSLSNTKPNSSFIKNQSPNRKEYLDWHFEVFAGYSASVSPEYVQEKLVGQSNGKIHRIKTERYLSSYRFATFRHPNLTDLQNKWYPEGKKIVPPDLELNPMRIAVWYCDDGSNCADNRSAVICTQGFMFEEAEMLVEKLHEFDLFATIVKKKSAYTGRDMPILKFHSKSYDNLIELVRPHIPWSCFTHKLKWRPAQKQWEYSGKFTEEKAKEVIELRKTQSAKEIAKTFGVHVNTIYALVSGRSWRHLYGS